MSATSCDDGAHRGPIPAWVSLCPVAFLGSLALTALSLGVVFFAQDRFSATPSQIGWLGGLFFASYGCACTATRGLMQRVSSPRLVLASIALAALCIAGMLRASSLPVFGLFYLACGASMSLYWAPLLDWFSSGVKAGDLHRVLGRYNISWSIGAIGGPYLAGVLSERASVLALQGALAISALALAWIAVLAATLSRAPAAAAGPAEGVAQPAGEDTPLRYPSWVGLFALFFASGVILVTFPVWAREEALLPEGMIGGILLTRMIVITTLFFLLGRFTYWQFRISWVIGAPLVAAVPIFGLMYLEAVPFLFVLMGLLGIPHGIVYSNSLFHGTYGGHRGWRMAVHEAILAAGVVLGSMCGGVVYETWSLGAAYGLSVAVLLVGAAVQFFAYRCFGSLRVAPEAAPSLLS